jgi:hypothetical protein
MAAPNSKRPLELRRVPGWTKKYAFVHKAVKYVVCHDGRWACWVGLGGGVRVGWGCSGGRWSGVCVVCVREVGWVGDWVLGQGFEHSKVCTLCYFGHLQFSNDVDCSAAMLFKSRHFLRPCGFFSWSRLLVGCSNFVINNMSLFAAAGRASKLLCYCCCWH